VTNKLYIIATPLGNLEDITLRAQKCLKELSYFFVEDTREFHKLIGLLQIDAAHKKAFSFASHNMKESLERALRILAEGNDIGFLTDRGTPAISDPGALLVEEARKQGCQIVPVPGPSSVSTIVSVAGLRDPRFLFIGFFPQGKKEREELLSLVKQNKLPLVFMESPQRVREIFELLKKEIPGSRLFIGREMTKIFEEFRWLEMDGSSAEALPEKGEYTLLLDPSSAQVQTASELSEMIRQRGLTDKEWAKEIAPRFHTASSEIYNELQRIKKRL
jgi:16S rRNA (cytidine1402-2'-O)-methyltransferase